MFLSWTEAAVAHVKMRKDTLYALGSVALFAWICMTYFLFVHRPNLEAARRRQGGGNGSDLTLSSLAKRVDAFEAKLKKSSQENSQLLVALKKAVQEGQSQRDQLKKNLPQDAAAHDSSSTSSKRATTTQLVIPVLMFACNRVTVNKALDSLLHYRKDKEKFPIIVSQDCAHPATADVIRSYGDEIIYIQQPDQSDIEVPKKEKKFKGYFKIARHYGWALNQTLNKLGYQQVIVVEDDLEVAPDFYEYFEATLPILKADSTLWCVSAWNDNGKNGLIDETKPEMLHRTDFFGGLGWMLTKELWNTELSAKWPKSYWDDWMRQPAQRRGRACIRPEISRTKTFGKVGVSNGLFFDKHLKFIVLSSTPVPFMSHDLSYLLKQNYDPAMDRTVNRDAPVVSLLDLKNGGVKQHKAVRVVYHTKEVFKKMAKSLGIMDDFKSGVPRMAYRGTVATMFRGQRVYLAPGLNWKGYDPKW